MTATSATNQPRRRARQSNNLTGATTDMATKKKTRKKNNGRKPELYAIIANKNYGLYCGIVESRTPDDAGNITAEVRECRHVARWYGKTGGITSLAAHGLCGPNASQSRIGAPVRATLTGVVNIFECSDAARRSLESAVQS